jgi:hypothetical protein
MTRPLAAVFLLALPAAASAQVPRQLPPGPYEVVVWRLNPRQVIVGPPITDGVSQLYRVVTLGGGSMSGLPTSWYPAGLWGNAYHIIVPTEFEVPVEVPVEQRPRDRENIPKPVRILPPVAASGVSSATLAVQFPATAEVWVGGKKLQGDAVTERPMTSSALIAAEVHGSQPTEWTVTSPVLNPGETHTLEVKGRWSVGGKTFEASRSVNVTAGNRARLIVVSGTEVQQ